MEDLLPLTFKANVLSKLVAFGGALVFAVFGDQLTAAFFVICAFISKRIRYGVYFSCAFWVISYASYWFFVRHEEVTDSFVGYVNKFVWWVVATLWLAAEQK